jgi:hypothetical protein
MRRVSIEISDDFVERFGKVFRVHAQRIPHFLL